LLLYTFIKTFKDCVQYTLTLNLHRCYQRKLSRCSSVGIATGYGLDSPEFESRWGPEFPHLSRPALEPTQPLYNGSRVFLGGKERLGRDADPSTPSSAVVKKEQSYTSTPPMGRKTCTEPQCLYKGALYLYLYFY